MATLASRAAKPDGARTIDEVQDAGLRATLPLTEVWGVGAKTVQRLEALGVHRLADLDEVSPARLLEAGCIRGWPGCGCR